MVFNTYLRDILNSLHDFLSLWGVKILKLGPSGLDNQPPVTNSAYKQLPIAGGTGVHTTHTTYFRGIVNNSHTVARSSNICAFTKY